MLPTPVFWPGEFRGLYSPWGPKDSDMTERPSLSRNVHCTKVILSFPFPYVIIHKVHFFSDFNIFKIDIITGVSASLSLMLKL